MAILFHCFISPMFWHAEAIASSFFATPLWILFSMAGFTGKRTFSYLFYCILYTLSQLSFILGIFAKWWFLLISCILRKKLSLLPRSSDGKSDTDFRHVMFVKLYFYIYSRYNFVNGEFFFKASGKSSNCLDLTLLMADQHCFVHWYTCFKQFLLSWIMYCIIMALLKFSFQWSTFGQVILLVVEEIPA